LAKSTLPASRSSEGRRPSSGAAPPAGALAPDPPPAPAAEGGAKRQCCALERSDAATLLQVAILALVLVFLPPTAAVFPPPLRDIYTKTQEVRPCCTRSAGSACAGPQKLHMGHTYVLVWKPGPSLGAPRLAPTQKRVTAETGFTRGHHGGPYLAHGGPDGRR
jgi:hypothetical protein